MRLDYKTGEIATIVGAELVGDSASLIQNVVYDSRKVVHGENSLFVCIKTKNQDGHHYISDAITKGVRIFLVADKKYVSSYEDYLVLNKKYPVIDLGWKGERIENSLKSNK